MKEETYELIRKVKKILTVAMCIWSALIVAFAAFNYKLPVDLNALFYFVLLFWLLPVGVVALVRYLLPTTSYVKTAASGRPIQIEKDQDGKIATTVLGSMGLQSELCNKFEVLMTLSRSLTDPDLPLMLVFRWQPNGVRLFSFTGARFAKEESERDTFLDFNNVTNTNDRSGRTMAVVPLPQEVLTKIEHNGGMDYIMIFCALGKDDPVLAHPSQFDMTLVNAIHDLENFAD